MADPIRTNAPLEKSRVLLRSSTASRCPVAACSERLAQVQRRSRELCIPTPVFFAYVSHQLVRGFVAGRRLCHILWTITVSEVMVFTIMEVLHAAYYGVRA